jgi:hypothetical protein
VSTTNKRQAYSFAFPPSKKEAFSRIAQDRYQRPASWLLLQAIDQIIENGGLLGDDAAQAVEPRADSDQWEELRAEIDQLRHCLRSCATTEYVNEQLELLRASITALSKQQSLIGTASAKAKKTGSPKA